MQLQRIIGQSCYAKLTTIFVVAILLLRSSSASAQTPASLTSNIQQVILPWQTSSIDARVRSAARTNLQESAKALANAIGAQKTSRDPKATHNLNVETRDFFFSEQRSSSPNPIAWIPTWCSIATANVIVIQAVDLQTGFVLKSVHAHTARELTANRAVKDWTWLNRLTAELSDELRSISPPSSANSQSRFAVHTLLETTRKDSFDASCLNLLAIEEISSSRTLVATDALEDLHLARRRLNINVPFKRFNRTLQLGWFLEQKPITQADADKPLKLELMTQTSEGVFGTRSQPDLLKNIDLDLRSTKLQLGVLPLIEPLLKAEDVSLRKDERPQISRIYGAWAYVDRGRAWGLRMNDRLELSDASGTVKGHVVGFYGSAMNIKSPRGFPVAEGAIVFIRKGQKEIKIGQELMFDQTKYPTSWPPPEKK